MLISYLKNQSVKTNLYYNSFDSKIWPSLYHLTASDLDMRLSVVNLPLSVDTAAHHIAVKA